MKTDPQKVAKPGDTELSGARAFIDEQIAGLESMRDRIGPGFTEALNAITACRGRLTISGLGKSGAIAKKLAGTFTSTGTPCFFLHPVEAAHGDLGLVGRDDVIIIISKSGGSDELRQFISPLKRMGITIIAMTSVLDSYLGNSSDIVLDIGVNAEAGALGLAPTTSTTASLVMGDALACALTERKGFTAGDFALNHPSGILGRRLTLTVGELMRKGNDVPLVAESTNLRDALLVIMEKSLGCTGVVNEAGTLTGIITDGDLKRIFASHDDAMMKPVSEMMTRSPRTIDADMLAADALTVMELDSIGPLLMMFIVDDQGHPSGVLQLHDILRAGLRAE
jgi:arabinose-5-phosphate isomerase